MTLLARLSTPLLAPLLVRQGRRAREVVDRLPEAEGPREGVSGSGRPLRLIVVGDSSGAGVGAATQSDALLGRTVETLVGRAGASAAGAATPALEVRWRLVARSGWRTAQALRAVEVLDPGARFDVAVTALGVNDASARVPLGGWLDQQARLRDELRRRGVRRMVVSGFPPVHRFPALPQPLRWWLGARARRMSDALRDRVAAEPDVHFLPLDFTLDVTAMASDGFHPGPRVYAEWGRRAAEALGDGR